MKFEFKGLSSYEENSTPNYVGDTIVRSVIQYCVYMPETVGQHVSQFEKRKNYARTQVQLDFSQYYWVKSKTASVPRVTSINLGQKFQYQRLCYSKCFSGQRPVLEALISFQKVDIFPEMRVVIFQRRVRAHF